MSDAMFDQLAALHNYNTVGAREGDEKHFKQLYSLKKAFTGEKAPGFVSTWKSTMITSPKLDGAAISLLYVGGELVQATTRGDGKVGKSITKLVRGSDLVPKFLTTHGTLFITGELVAPKSIENARNYAAGACGLKDVIEFNSRHLHFIVYGVEGVKEDSYCARLKDIADLGFRTVIQSNYEQFPQDGIVMRVDSTSEFEALGHTSTHPRGAYALKNKADFEVGETTLLDVIWQIGQSGQVTPVAIFEPVTIDDASVSKASLANAGVLEALELSIGDRIQVIRSGGIIPKVIGKV